MQETLRNEPEYFWYYNNGITIVCDQAESIGSRGRDILRVTNPQVINGQQTTRVIHQYARSGRNASVIIRVVRVPREERGNGDYFETLVSQIVAATNWQNAIRPSDLMSNDRRQIDLERKLRKLGYEYIRKRQTKREARRGAATRARRFIKKEDLAQAVAACDLDPVVVRLGKEGLFEEDRYHQVFSSGDPQYYLTRYWLMRQVGGSARGYPERAYAKWLVLHFTWSQLSPLLRSKRASQQFFRACEVNHDMSVPLRRAIDAAAFVAALRFYRNRRGKGQTAIDVSTFFKRVRLHKDFDRYWRGGKNISRKRFRNHWSRFHNMLKREIEA
jgi:hypothetical protein